MACVTGFCYGWRNWKLTSFYISFQTDRWIINIPSIEFSHLTKWGVLKKFLAVMDIDKTVLLYWKSWKCIKLYIFIKSLVGKGNPAKKIVFQSYKFVNHWCSQRVVDFPWLSNFNNLLTNCSHQEKGKILYVCQQHETGGEYISFSMKQWCLILCQLPSKNVEKS